MATSNHRASPHSTLFFGIAASASQVRNEKRNRIANRSGAHPIEARPPQTSLIDAEWDLEPFAPAVDDAETFQPSTLSPEPQLADPVSVRPPHTSLIDAEWEAIPDTAQEPPAPALSIRAPRTTAIDEGWEPLTTRTRDESQALARPEFVRHGEEEPAVQDALPRQALRGRSVATVTLAALLAIATFAAVLGLNFANRQRALPHAASMLHHAPLPNGGAFVRDHWNADWLESAATEASRASAALAEAEAVAKSIPKKPVVYRRAPKAATVPSQAVANDASDPAAINDGQPATSAAPPVTVENEQPPAAATPATSQTSD